MISLGFWHQISGRKGKKEKVKEKGMVAPTGTLWGKVYCR